MNLPSLVRNALEGYRTSKLKWLRSRWSPENVMQVAAVLPVSKNTPTPELVRHGAPASVAASIFLPSSFFAITVQETLELSPANTQYSSEDSVLFSEANSSVGMIALQLPPFTTPRKPDGTLQKYEASAPSFP